MSQPIAGKASQRNEPLFCAAAVTCAVVACWTMLLSVPLFGEDWAQYRYTASAFAQEVSLAGGGNVTAQLSVAKAYYAGTTGTTDARNYSQAFTFFQNASNNGSAEAKAWLGSLYLHGQGVVKSTTTALSLIQASASANNPVGLRFLGLMYEGGQGVTQNFATAASYFSQAIALNDPESYDRLGYLYLKGLGVKRNVSEAITLFNQGITLGDSWSQLQLGELYATGIAPLTKNAATALGLYVQAAANGNYLAAFRAAVGYEGGIGVTQNVATALSYYKQSATAGFAPAQNELGIYYQKGYGGAAVDYVQSFIWYCLASEQGNEEASYNLASLLPLMTAAQIQEAQTALMNWQISRGGVPLAGTATVTITGFEREVIKTIGGCTGDDVAHATGQAEPICPPDTTITIPDIGRVSIIVNGYTESVSYGSGSTSSSVATALAVALDSDPNSLVTAWASANVVTVTSKAVGLVGNYSLSTASATSDTTYFTGTSFPATASGSSLTGGVGN